MEANAGFNTKENSMTNNAEIINFPNQNDKEPNQPESEIVKADLDNGYFRIANELARTLCKTILTSRESRILNAVMVKTFGFNKSMDWVCYEQLADMTGIDVTNVGKVKMALVKRNILIVDGKKIGINTTVSEWVNNKKESETTQNKKSQKRLKNKSEMTHERVKNDSNLSQKRLTQKKDTNTKNNTTKDNIDLPDFIDVNIYKSFKKMRTKIKAPMTLNAETLLIGKLTKFHDSGYCVNKLLGNSEFHCWKDVYEPKPNDRHNFLREEFKPSQPTNPNDFDPNEEF